MTAIRPSRPTDGLRAVEIWANAVDATHHFLLPRDREAIGAEVADFLPDAPLYVAVDAYDRAIAFMLVEHGCLEALFVDPAHHGAGIGKALVQLAISRNPGLKVDVNAQNTGAIAFYFRLGFAETGRSGRDSQGRPYPLIHMQHSTAAG